jgi:spermidine synthase
MTTARQHLGGERPMRIGVVGLGIGMVLAYAERGDYLRCYEINPDVVRIAREHFTLIEQCRGEVEIVLGDARLSLERELNEPQQFDVMVLDAFTGDAIPVHLLTRECFDVYLKHLRAGGVIAAHISNQHLDLVPVLLGLAEHFNLHAAMIDSPENKPAGEYEARWMILTTDRSITESPPIRRASSALPSKDAKIRLWTDERTNLFELLTVRQPQIEGAPAAR